MDEGCTCDQASHLNVQVRGDGDAPGPGHLGQCSDAVLDVDPLIHGEPGALGDAEGGSEQLHEDGLAGLTR